METESGRTDHSLEDSLFERGYEFDFFQAVRLLQRIFPDRDPVGHSVSPAKEVVPFRSRQSLAFPASTVHQLERPENGSTPAMEVSFLGLTGPQGTLPMSYTELIIQRRAKQDTASAAFFDIFNHRLTGLFYRPWESTTSPLSMNGKKLLPRRRGMKV
jgi:type VI secretion system protein ImpH